MRLKIEQHDISPRSARIWLDGNEITRGLTELSVSFSAVDITHAELKIHVDDLELDAETLVVLQAHVQEDEE